MASVYLARDTELNRPVALKVLAPHLAEEESSRARFLQEARVAARLAHPNVVRVFDVGEDERGPFIVMEYVEGETLADELQRRGRFSPQETVELAIQLCSGLEAAHAAALVHRDLKPQNVLLGSDGTAKIADFGIARALDATFHTAHGTVLGTAAYLSPEQARGESVSAAADLYTLGIVLYELLTGRRPFDAETLPELLVQRDQPITPPSQLTPEIPAELEHTLMRCLTHDPASRPESAATLARQLAETLPEPPAQPLPEPSGTKATEVLAPSPSVATRQLRRVRSNRGRPLALLGRRPAALVGLAAALLLALGLALDFALDRSPQDRAEATTLVQQTEPTVAATPPPASAAPATTESSTSCTELERRKQDLENRKREIDQRKKETKDKAQRDMLKQQKKEIEEQKHTLDEQLRTCR